MTVETDKYVNSWSHAYTPHWGITGSSPYLDADDVSYISCNTVAKNLYKEGDFDFPNSAGSPSDTINSVKLRFRDSISNLGSNNYYTAYVYDGTNWFKVADMFPAWTAFTDEADQDVSAILNTWTKINACQVYVQFVGFDNYLVKISECRRIVDYTAAGVAPTYHGDGLTCLVYMLKRRLPRFRYATRVRLRQKY